MRSIFLTIVLIIMMAMNAEAHTRRQKFNISSAIRSADFVFHAKVVDISYGMSKAGRGYEVLPHTFVTFEMKKVLKGNPRQAQDRFTLRFLGGRAEQARFFHPGEYPLFDLGDEEILFIRNNNKSGCPLVNCAEGRFRSISGRIYDDLGHQVVLTKKQDVDFGVMESLPDVLTHKVSQTTLIRRQVESDSEGKPEPGLPIGEQFSTERFLGFLDAKVSSMYSREALDKWPLIKSADIREPFFVKLPRQVVGKSRTPSNYSPIKKPTESDLLEQRELDKNQGNPVIK